MQLREKELSIAQGIAYKPKPDKHSSKIQFFSICDKINPFVKEILWKVK